MCTPETFYTAFYFVIETREISFYVSFEVGNACFLNGKIIKSLQVYSSVGKETNDINFVYKLNCHLP
jgi:hypothetical protein